MTFSAFLSNLIHSLWVDFWRARQKLVVFDLLFKILEAWLLVPAVAFLLSVVLARSGHVALTNKDIVDFLVTPWGIFYSAILGTLTVGLILLEQAGIMILAGWADSPKGTSFGSTLRHFLGKLPGILGLGGLLLLLGILVSAPFIGLAFLTYQLLLSQQDINFYLNDRPPELWVAGGIGGFLLAGLLISGLIVYVRIALSLPLLIFEGKSPLAAIRTSNQVMSQASWGFVMALIGWPVFALASGVLLGSGFRQVAAWVLNQSTGQPIALITGLLLAQGAMVAIHSVVAFIVNGLLIRQLYLVHCPHAVQVRQAAMDYEIPKTKNAPNWFSSPWQRGFRYLTVILILLAPLFVWVELKKQLTLEPLVLVTAHRGYSLAAPENTLSSVREAIRSGADYAEIDVQVTSDGVVILAHDSDWKRVGRDPRLVAEVSYKDVQKLDVGSWFGSAFAGEKVPTLAEVIDLAQGKIRLNIELKFYGLDRRLVPEVARLIRENQFESECLVTTFQYDAAMELKRNNPRIRTGLIVAKSLGDISQLDVEALSVRAEWLSDPLLAAAKASGKEVHVWTVNEAGAMVRLMKRGVTNIITDDPELLIRVRKEWSALSGSERLILASRLLLGLDP